MTRSIISSPTNAPTNFYYHITGDSKERNTVLPPVRQLNVSDLLRTDLTEYCWRYPKKVYCIKYTHTYEYEYHISTVMQILIPSTASAATIFLILSSPYGCIYLKSLKITSTQGRLSMNSLSSSSLLDMDRDLFFHYRSWTWTEPNSFEQAISQTWCHRKKDFCCESRRDECHTSSPPHLTTWSQTRQLL